MKGYFLTTFKDIESQFLMHFEVPRSRQRDLPPFYAILLFQSHPKNSLCDIINLLPASKDMYLTNITKITLPTTQTQYMNFKHYNSGCL